jgi:hypothetical protein
MTFFWKENSDQYAAKNRDSGSYLGSHASVVGSLPDNP